MNLLPSLALDLLERLPHAMVLADGGLRLRGVNAAASSLLGAPSATLTGRPFMDLLGREERPRLEGLLGQGREQLQFNAEAADGRLLECRLRRLDLDGEAVWLVLLADTTAPQEALAALRSSEERYRRMVEASPDGVALLEDGVVVFANGALERLLALDSPDQLWGSEMEGFLHPDDAGAWRGLMRACLETRRSQRQELTLARPGGGSLEIELELQPLGGAQDHAMLLLARDIRERKTMERRLRESEERYKGLADVAFDGLAVHVDGVIVSVNRSFEAIFGQAAGALLGADLFSLFTDATRQLLRQGLDSGLVLELEGEAEQGGAVHVEASTRACLFHGEPAYVTALRDITRRRQTEDVVRRQAWYDALTGLPNRILFLDRLEHALSSARRDGRRVAVLFLDLDRFKLVNDSLGHSAGDQLLQLASGRLQGLLRKSDTVARLGGDEFTVLVEDASMGTDVLTVARKIVEALREPFTVQEQPVHIGTSVGLAIFPDHAADAERLIKCADMAMYRAKHSGRNQAVAYAEDLESRQEHRLGLENDLRRAVERRQFLLWYQPQVDLATGRVVGAEALLRWRHPTRGLLMPADFLHLAEESRLIVPLGEWVLNETCRQAMAWPGPGGNLSVAVNLSAWQLHRRNLVKTVDAALAASGLPAQRLELEISESVAMRNAALTLEMLREFSAKGVRLALDDFGQGYSSLAYLKDFPVQSIKLDQTFVAQLPDSAKDAAIVKAVLGICRSLDLRCLAEGVESAAQAAFLKAEGCQLAQGYLFAKPLSQEDFLALLASGSTLL